MTWTLVVWLPWLWVGGIAVVAVGRRPRVRRTVAPAPRLADPGQRPPRPVGHRAIAAATAVVAGALLVDVRLAAAGVLVAWGGPRLRDARRRASHGRAVRRELPEVIDLLALGLAAGGSISAASHAVGRYPFGPVSRAMTEASRLVGRGHRFADALERSLASCGPATVPLVRALVGSDRYGTELRPVLDRLATEAREERRRAAQADARRVPVRMLLPLVVCVLPAFILLSVVPALAGTFDGLGFGDR